MEELLYLEVPTPDTDKVCHWLQTSWQPRHGEKQQTPTGIRLVANGAKLSIFTWNVQRTTYLKVFAWASGFPQPQSLCRQLKSDLEQAFPNQYPAPLKFNQANPFLTLWPQIIRKQSNISRNFPRESLTCSGPIGGKNAGEKR